MEAENIRDYSAVRRSLSMSVVAIVASGPTDHLPDFAAFEEVDVWIGVDRGAYVLAKSEIEMDVAVGDFDSVTEEERMILERYTATLDIYPKEKNETDLEIALEKAFEMKAHTIYLFGVTGGRMDHTMINIQLLLRITARKIKGVIIDKWNRIELVEQGIHTVEKDQLYPYVSFVPLTDTIEQLRLEGFAYPLDNFQLRWGSTRCISNEINDSSGTISFESGKLLIIQSRDQ